MVEGSPPVFSSAVARGPDGIAVEVWIVPGANRTEITGLHGKAIRIRVAAPPAGGHANRALVAFLEAVTGGSVELLRGGRGRRKTLLVRGVAHGEVLERISGQTG